MTPLLICAYNPRYLEHVLNWFRAEKVEDHYKLFIWDNGGAAPILRKFDLEWQCAPDEAGAPVNIGKALAMRYLMDVVNEQMPDADCYVCMDDDIIVDRLHLDALVAAARRPGLGMIAARFHPFNAVVPPGGTVTAFEGDLSLLTYAAEDRTVHNTGRVAGGLFALSKASISRSPWAPYLYPILTDDNQEPVLYWTEDASLDGALTGAGLTNGYLANTGLMPAIHLPEMNDAYKQWKLLAQRGKVTKPFTG